MPKKTQDENILDTALTSIEVAIENVDMFGRSTPFKWSNGRDVIMFEEHKEVMKIMLYWKREVEIYKELLMEKEG